ncbi:MAG: hypothetical protein ACREBQ_12680 [Nitrososphaerales archaeon]
MNTAAGLSLFLLGSFVLLYTTIHIPSIEFYTGGIVIALFIFGLFFAFGNAIRQGNKIEKSETGTIPQTEQNPKKETPQSATSTA